MGKYSLGKKWLWRDYTGGAVFLYRRDLCHKNPPWLWSGIGLMIGLFLLVIFFIVPALFHEPAWAQKEVTSKPYRYSERELSSRYYETHEAKPRTYPVFVRGGIPQREAITLSPIAERVRRRKYLADSHWGLKFYERLTCKKCHPPQARNLHKIRAKITCRQCHGPEPIAGLSHYNSPMYPRRRHVFICAKCHEGANTSFATYVVHEPSPAVGSTRLDDGCHCRRHLCRLFTAHLFVGFEGVFAGQVYVSNETTFCRFYAGLAGAIAGQIFVSVEATFCRRGRKK
jgi:hypothetical protein